MEIGSLRASRAALEGKKLEDDERVILAALIEAGYDEEGRPLGYAGRLSSNDLAQAIYSIYWDMANPVEREELHRFENCKRRVRAVVNSLIIAHGISIMCRAGIGGGYYLPATKEEVEENSRSFHRRAMTGLIKESRGRKAAYADAMVQLTLGFEGEAEGYRELTGGPAEDGPPAWVTVVTGLLEQVKGDPVKYAAEIRRLQEQFGDIFVRRDRVEKLKELSGELSRVLEGLQ
jgi:hypothetical protein